MRKRLHFMMVISIIVSTLVGCGTDKESEAYPNSVVTVIIPYAVGGSSDVTVRALVAASRESFPENITVVNRAGGAGIVGMSYGAKSKPDGYTITMIAPEIMILPHLGAGAGLKYTDFTPVMMYNSGDSAITVRKDSPYNTLEEFITAAKTQSIQVGNAGVGGIWHLAAAGLAKAANIKLIYVPFEGSGPAVTDLLGGHIDAVSVSYPEVAAQVEAGALKVLVMLAENRQATIPDVPTAKELGYDIQYGTWRGLAVPNTTPKEIVDEIYAIFSKTVENEQFKKIMRESNNDIVVLNGAELTARMEREDVLFKSLVEDLGLSVNK